MKNPLKPIRAAFSRLPPPLRRLVHALVTVAILALVHAILLRWAADRNVAAAILSGGPHTPLVPLALAVSLLTVRLCLFLVAPAMLLRAVVRCLFDLRPPPKALD